MNEKMPYFLTPTLVSVTKSLTLNQKMTKGLGELWVTLEKEFLRRINHLDNDAMTTVVHSFGVAGKGSRHFFGELEEYIIQSPIPYEVPHLEKILIGYMQ